MVSEKINPPTPPFRPHLVDKHRKTHNCTLAKLSLIVPLQNSIRIRVREPNQRNSTYQPEEPNTLPQECTSNELYIRVHMQMKIRSVNTHTLCLCVCYAAGKHWLLLCNRTLLRSVLLFGTVTLCCLVTLFCDVFGRAVCVANELDTGRAICLPMPTQHPPFTILQAKFQPTLNVIKTVCMGNTRNAIINIWFNMKNWLWKVDSITVRKTITGRQDSLDSWKAWLWLNDDVLNKYRFIRCLQWNGRKAGIFFKAQFRLHKFIQNTTLQHKDV